MKAALDLEALFALSSETGQVDFKSQLDVENDSEWLEVIKDILAMANSGGGMIVFGVQDDGAMSEFDAENLLAFDVANITAKVRKWTGIDLPGVSWEKGLRGSKPIVALKVDAVDCPISFIKDGQYTIQNHIKFAFRAGQFFFRHGAKSEPGTANDLQLAIERKLSVVREQWLGNIRKVVEAPSGSVIQVVTPQASALAVHEVRLVDNESGVPHKMIHSDQTHPLRQSDVIREVNVRLNGRMTMHQGHMQDIRRVHHIKKKSAFYFKGTFPGSQSQFSHSFVDWIVENFDQNPDFFTQAREARRALTVARNDARSEKLKSRQTEEVFVS